MEHSTLRVAWRNLGRNRRRTLLAAGAIALGQITLVFVSGLMAGSFHQTMQTITGPLIGHVQVQHPQWLDERAPDLFVDHRAEVCKQIAALPGVRQVLPRIYTATFTIPGEKGDEPATAEPGLLVGVDVAAESGAGGLLELLAPEDMPSGDDVVLGPVLATRLGLKPGDRIAVIGQDIDGFPASDLFNVKGTLSCSVDSIKTMGVVMTIDRASRFLAMPDKASMILVRGEDFREAGTLAKHVAALPLLKGSAVQSWQETAPWLAHFLRIKGWFDLIFIGIVFVAAAAGIANTATMSTFERTHEFGMLLAFGTRPGRIVRMVLTESVVLGLIGVAVGSIIGAALVLVTGHTGIDYAALSGSNVKEISYSGVSMSYIIYPVFEWRYVVLGVCAATGTSLLASLWPAVLAARLEPVEAMRS